MSLCQVHTFKLTRGNGLHVHITPRYMPSRITAKSSRAGENRTLVDRVKAGYSAIELQPHVDLY